MQSQFIFWVSIAALALLDAVLAQYQSIKVTAGPAVFLGIFVLIMLYLIYSRIRPKPRIAMFALSGLQLVAFSAVACVLSYLVAIPNLPLIDKHLAAADRAIGFDWLAMFNWVRRNPIADSILNIAYLSAVPQVFLALLVLNVTERFDRMREFLLLFASTLLVIIAASSIFPAAGAWQFYGVADLTSNYYLPDFNALRAGTIHEIDLTNANGIIQFPSFHASVGLILIFAARGIRFVFPAALVLNITMIISSLTHGGHHLADVLAGLAIVPPVAWLLRLGPDETRAAAASI